MRIAIFSDLFLPHIDGITNSLVHLIKEYRRHGHEVLVITPKSKGSEHVSIEGIKIVFLPSVPAVVYPEFMFGLSSSKLFKELRKFSPEIVHVVTPGPVGNMGLFYSRFVNIKSVATFHGYFMEPEYLKLVGIKNRGVKIAQKILWKLTRSFYDRADTVITPSKFVKADLFAHKFSGPINVINNAINFSNVEFDNDLHQKFIKEYDLADNKIAIYVGRVSVEKNIKLLIESFPAVIKKVDNAKLLIVGAGPELAKLKHLVTSLKLQKSVIFTGEIKNSDLVTKGVLKLASVFVTASHSEVQPVSIIEAMHFGLPIVAAESRGLKEMIKGNGYLVKNDNKKKFSSYIVKFLTDDDFQKEMSEKSTKLAEGYSLSNSSKQHIKLYKKLIKENINSSFALRVWKSRIVNSYKDMLAVIATIHIGVFTYQYLVSGDLIYFNIFHVLGFQVFFPEFVYNNPLSGVISILFVVGLYMYFFRKNKRI